MVKNHAEMKRRLQAKEDFIMLQSIHDGFEGQLRTPNVIQTNAIYSVVKGEPEHKVSQMNNGKGCFMQFGKASEWHIENGICEYIGRNNERVFAFKFVADFEEEVDEVVSQMELSDLADEPKPKKREGRTITVERLDSRLPYWEFAISCETHDAYIYVAKDVYDAVEKYEDDRNCIVGKVYEYESGELLFDKQQMC